MTKKGIAAVRVSTILLVLWMGLTDGFYPSVPVHSVAAEQQTPSQLPDWKTVDTGRFTIQLPAWWCYKPLRGFDSFIGEFSGDGMRFVFDYGWYSNPLPEAGTPGYEVRFETIGGREAKLVMARSAPADITGVYFSKVSLNAGLPDNKLDIQSHRLSAAQIDVALRIFRSLTFPSNPPPLSSTAGVMPLASPNQCNRSYLPFALGEGRPAGLSGRARAARVSNTSLR